MGQICVAFTEYLNFTKRNMEVGTKESNDQNLMGVASLLLLKPAMYYMGFVM